MFSYTQKKNNNRSSSNALILHLDGDRRYSKRAINYYNRLNLNSIVENISERNQPQEVVYLLEKYRPNILISTGHDVMYKKGQDLIYMSCSPKCIGNIPTYSLLRHPENQRHRVPLRSLVCAGRIYQV